MSESDSLVSCAGMPRPVISDLETFSLEKEIAASLATSELETEVKNPLLDRDL